KMPTPQQMGDAPLESYIDRRLETDVYQKAKWELVSSMLEKLDFKQLERLNSEQKKEKIRSTAQVLIPEINLPINGEQHNLLKEQIIDEILGFGPIDRLMNDPEVSDIMINTHRSIY